MLAAAAILVGLAERMLSMTVDYVAARRQFGVPVGSFQAVKHRLADAYLAVEFARPAVLAAGWAQASGAADAAEQTSVAKVLASDAATTVARAAISATARSATRPSTTCTCLPSVPGRWRRAGARRTGTAGASPRRCA